LFFEREFDGLKKRERESIGQVMNIPVHRAPANDDMAIINIAKVISEID
jgi:hypothetical protein